MALVNDFLVGADPEFVILEAGHLRQFTENPGRYDPWGLDHSGWVIEPHPKPSLSVKELVKNLRTAFNDFATVAPTGKWVAGASLSTPERPITLGGHVHFDKPRCSEEQRHALDLFARHLEALDILPKEQCVERRRTNYGHPGDVRIEHGHFEYRTLPSWLFSQRVTKLCLTGTKLIMIDPKAPTETLGGTIRWTSIDRLKAMFERFKHKDDDADWVLSTVLTRKLAVQPDRDLRDVWKVEPKKETPHWKEAEVTNFNNVLGRPAPSATRRVAATMTDAQPANVWRDVGI